MLRWKRNATLAAVLCVSLQYAGHAQTTVEHFTVKGNTAVASFQATDPRDACIENSVRVVASDSMEKVSPGGGGQTAQARTIIVVSQQDLCRGVTLLSGEGDTAQHTFTFQNLRSATLQATVPVLDLINQQIFAFDVNLAWTAEGKAVFQQTKETFREPGFFISTQLRGFHADAQASGTVVSLGQNFTPEPSVSASLERVNDGTLVVQKTP